MTEEWRSVPGFGGHYEASSAGRVRVRDRVIRRKHSTGGMVDFHYKGRLLGVSKDRGYAFVTLGWDCITKKVPVHRLVLLAFVGEPPAGMEACHCNGDSLDNRALNLRWDTHYENNQDRRRHGTYAVGEAHPMAKIDADTVRKIRDSGLGCVSAAAKFGISPSHAHRIMKGQSWASLENT
jgi:hypothetical protein